MPKNISFRHFSVEDRQACLAVFDTNCPKYFAPNERQDYADYLGGNPSGYEVCLIDGAIVGAYGLSGVPSDYLRINWILISAQNHGDGIGHQFMTRILQISKQQSAKQIKIAASHLSAPFFAKYGAIDVKTTVDGWGPDMHRVDMVLSV